VKNTTSVTLPSNLNVAINRERAARQMVFIVAWRTQKKNAMVITTPPKY
jgi:hypothetical protein